MTGQSAALHRPIPYPGSELGALVDAVVDGAAGVTAAAGADGGAEGVAGASSASGLGSAVSLATSLSSCCLYSCAAREVYCARRRNALSTPGTVHIGQRGAARGMHVLIA